jgi:ABC-type multidrug transport system fused ATPase/permease subunit
MDFGNAQTTGQVLIGNVKENGKHEELLAQNGYYKRLNDMQAL